ncbi:MAG TPA: hypothetical protein VIK82_08380 [Porticoccaceae bacterium]|jgi:hypothetical protein
MSFDWKVLIGKAAPMLATALGGPLAGAAVATIGQALGLGQEASEEEIARKLASASPDVLLQLKKAEQEFSVKMAELGFRSQTDLARIEMEDRASARQREQAVQDWTPRILAFLITAGFFGMILALIWAPIPEGAKEPLLILIGTLGGTFSSIIAYYFGSTAGGQKKSELLAKSGGLR